MAEYGIDATEQVDTDTKYTYSDDTPDIPKELITLSQKPNLIEDFGDELPEVEIQIKKQFAVDEESMSDWLDKYEQAFKLARMSLDEDEEEKDFPFEGASKVMAPFLMEAAIEFNSRVTIDVIAADQPAKFKVIGQDKDKTKADRSDRTKTYFNTKLKKSCWVEESDKESIALPIVGTTYKKVYWEETEKECESYYRAADQIVFDMAFAFKDAPQHSEKVSYSRNELIGYRNAGLFEFDDADLKDKDEFEGFEAHFYYDLDGDDYAEPYIAVCLDGLGIVRVRAGFLPEGVSEVDGKVTHIARKEYYSQKVFIADPESNMGMGFGMLLADTYETINTNLRQLIDAGTLQNTAANSGLIANTTSPRMGADNRMSEGPIEIEIGKLKKVTVSSGQSLAQNVVQLPFKGPSPVLFQLLTYLDEAARRVSTVSYNIEGSPGEAASLYLAKLAQGMKVYNAVMFRYFRGLSKEFELMYKCIYEHASELQEDYVLVLDEDADIEADFNPNDCDIMPTANPAHGSDVERIAKAEAVVQSAQMNPQLNQRQAWMDYYEALGVENVEALMPEQEGPSPAEQQQAAYMAMEAEFRNREMQTREQRLVLDQMKMQLDALNAAANMEQEAMMNAAKVDNTFADTLKKLSESAVGRINQYMMVLDRYEQNLKQQVGEGSGENSPRSDTAMVDQSVNQSIPGVPSPIR